MELNFEVLEMQKWNVATDIFQIVDEINDVICLVTIFTQKDLPVERKWFAQAVTISLLPSSARTKRAMFYILIAMTLKVNLIFTIFWIF